MPWRPSQQHARSLVIMIIRIKPNLKVIVHNLDSTTLTMRPMITFPLAQVRRKLLIHRVAHGLGQGCIFIMVEIAEIELLVRAVRAGDDRPVDGPGAVDRQTRWGLGDEFLAGLVVGAADHAVGDPGPAVDTGVLGRLLRDLADVGPAGPAFLQCGGVPVAGVAGTPTFFGGDVGDGFVRHGIAEMGDLAAVGLRPLELPFAVQVADDWGVTDFHGGWSRIHWHGRGG